MDMDNEEIVHQLRLLALAVTDRKENALHNWGRDLLLRLNKGGR